MDRRRQLALLKVLAAAAWADGRLDPEEIRFIEELIRAYKLEPRELEEVQMLLQGPVPYSRCQEFTRELLDMLSTPEERREVLGEVDALFRADGSLDPDEIEVLDSLEGIMESTTEVDGFMGRITGVFRKVFSQRDPESGGPGDFAKNPVLRRVEEISGGEWRRECDAPTLHRMALVAATLGKVADAEGGKAPEELARVRRLLVERYAVAPPLIDWIMQAVEEAATSTLDRQALLSEFNRVAEMDERRRLLDGAFAVAAHDGIVSSEELEELRLISNYLWIDPRDFNAIRRLWKT
jgi:uncharacterized tellurite resistance protein B-like protein